MPISPALPPFRATRLIAASREAEAQSEAAIRRSLRLLRDPIYPADASVGLAVGGALKRARP